MNHRSHPTMVGNTIKARASPFPSRCESCPKTSHAGHPCALRWQDGSQVGLMLQNNAGGHYASNQILNNRAANVTPHARRAALAATRHAPDLTQAAWAVQVLFLGRSCCVFVRNAVALSPGGGILVRGKRPLVPRPPCFSRS